jgi:hypothetical protein
LEKKEHIYIACLFWNNEKLIKEYWAAALLDLIQHSGKDNVYMGWDDTEGALRELDLELDKLGVERTIEFLDETHADKVNWALEKGEKGWIDTSRGKKELRRIPYLAVLRNRAMEKLK